jgi:hypothetical protein
MEALGVAASIVGIVSIAIQGIDSIQKLRDFCHDFSTINQASREFQKQLVYLDSILKEVRKVCSQLEDANYTKKNDFNLATLLIQVEDCTADLSQWNAIADHLVRSKVEKGRSVRNVFESFLKAINKRAISDASRQTDVHLNNIHLALSTLSL